MRQRLGELGVDYHKLFGKLREKERARFLWITGMGCEESGTSSMPHHRNEGPAALVPKVIDSCKRDDLNLLFGKDFGLRMTATVTDVIFVNDYYHNNPFPTINQLDLNNVELVKEREEDNLFLISFGKGTAADRVWNDLHCWEDTYQRTTLSTRTASALINSNIVKMTTTGVLEHGPFCMARLGGNDDVTVWIPLAKPGREQYRKLVVHNLTPDEAHAPLLSISPPFLPYRDAGYGAATYHISVLECLRGLHKALTIGLLDLENIDVSSYEFYERVENGDFNWISNKFLALASPKDDPPGGVPMMGSPGAYNPPNTGISVVTRSGYTTTTANGSSYSSMLTTGLTSAVSSIMSRTAAGTASSAQQPTSVSPYSRLFPAYRMDDLIRYMLEHNVRTIVRLNNKIYDRKKFGDAGIDHVEMYFPDGTTPPDGILKRFLDLCENRAGPIAVHCKAGLGRTGTLIAAYFMKHYKFTASEVISYLRIVRPGSVVGPQQNYLQSMQAKLWKMHPSTILPSTVSCLTAPTYPNLRRWAASRAAVESFLNRTHTHLPSRKFAAPRAPQPAIKTDRWASSTSTAGVPMDRNTASPYPPASPMQISDAESMSDDDLSHATAEMEIIRDEERAKPRGVERDAYGGGFRSGARGGGVGGHLRKASSDLDELGGDATKLLGDFAIPVQPRKHMTPPSAAEQVAGVGVGGGRGAPSSGTAEL
ncbi:Dual specificity protein phosphatase cdc14a, partial [Rhizophlyctis rosea]